MAIGTRGYGVRKLEATEDPTVTLAKETSLGESDA
jgi:hypothetical protein